MRNAWPLAAALVAMSALAARADDAGGPIRPDAGAGTVTLRLDAARQPPAGARLRVFVGPADACCDGRTPMAGDLAPVAGGLVFTPAFPFIAGQAYTAETVLDGEWRKTAFTMGEAEAPRPEVLAVYPGGPVIPENTLRFYIRFSTPMQPHLAARFITLTDAEGRPDDAAFMAFTQELWNADRTRLTLLMDPGRIKRGVAQNVALGPALEAGKRYAITIGAGWPGALGGQMAEAHVVPFVIGPPLRTRPDPALFDLSEPRIGSRDPLVVRFDRPFDRVRLDDALTLVAPDGSLVAGTAEPREGERAWVFVPRDPWPGGPLRLAVDARLEDVAGNNFRDALDHALSEDLRDVDTLFLPVRLRKGS